METPRFKPMSGASELIGNTFGISQGFQNIFSRAQALKQQAEVFELEKQKFAADMATTNLHQEQVRGQIAEQNYRLLEAEDATTTRNRLRTVRSDRLRQASRVIGDAMAREDIWKDPMSVRVLRGEVMAQFADLEKDPEFATIAQQFLERVTAAEGGLMIRAQAAAQGLTPKLATISTPQELKELQRSPFHELAMQEPNYAAQFGALHKQFAEIAKEDRAREFEREKLRMQIEGEIDKERIKAHGGKELTDTATGSIGSFRAAQQDLARIEAAFEKVSKDWRTGPIAGRVTGWTTMWNKDFQSLEKLITQTVPNLARGVFREVGVLTDKDVERYRSLLPNAKQDPEVAKQLFAELQEKLETGFETVLDTYGRAGYNVSGFDDLRAANKKPIAGSGAQAIAQKIKNGRNP